MSVVVPVSVGEAFDKLSILYIKRDFFKHGQQTKLDAVQREIESLEPHLDAFRGTVGSWLDALEWINRRMWKCVDVYHEEGAKKSSMDTDKFVNACLEIQQHNAARYRAKRKIEEACNSNLREQKSHARTRVVFVGHLRSGDQITNIGIVRYLSVYYDEVEVFCLQNTLKTMRHVYRDDLLEDGGGILLRAVASIEVGMQETKHLCLRDSNTRTIAVGYMHPSFCGSHDRKWLLEFYKHFFSESDVPYDSRWTFTYIRRDIPRENRLYELALRGLERGERYAFVHDKPSEKQLVTLSNLPRDIYKYHPNRDLSGDKTWTGLLSDFCLTEYATLIEKSKEIHVVDSSFFCLCQLLDLSRVERLCVYMRSTTGQYDIKGYMHDAQRDRWEIL